MPKKTTLSITSSYPQERCIIEDITWLNSKYHISFYKHVSAFCYVLTGRSINFEYPVSERASLKSAGCILHGLNGQWHFSSP